MLYVIVGFVILNVRKVLPFGMLLLEGWGGHTWKDNVCNCTTYHFPNVDGQIDSSLIMVLVALWCIITTLTSHDLVMEFMQKKFIHNLYISQIDIMHWKHIWHTYL
jgi:hypothetical protein